MNAAIHSNSPESMRTTHSLDPEISHSIHGTGLSGQGPPDVAREAFWWSRSAEWHKAIDMAFDVCEALLPL